MEINISPNIHSIRSQILDENKNHLKLYYKMSCMKNKRQTKKDRENFSKSKTVVDIWIWLQISNMVMWPKRCRVCILCKILKAHTHMICKLTINWLDASARITRKKSSMQEKKLIQWLWSTIKHYKINLTIQIQFPCNLYALIRLMHTLKKINKLGNWQRKLRHDLWFGY